MMRQINLLPKNIQSDQSISSIRNSLLATVGPAVLIVLVIHFLLVLRVGHLKEAAYRPPEPSDTPEIRQLRTELQSMKKDGQKFIEKNQMIMDVLAQNISTPNILAIIAEVTAERVWLQGLSINTNNRTCQLKGHAFNTRVVSEFMLELRKLPYFSNVELINMGKKDEPKGKEVDFEIVCTFK